MPLDTKLFDTHMSDSSPLTVLLKGHLWVESTLNRGLEVALANPTSMNLDRLPFGRKVELCEGLGLLRAAEANSIKLLNSLRNKLAHQLHSDPTHQDVDRLDASLVGNMKVGMDGLKPLPSNVTVSRRLERWFNVCLIVMEYANMLREYEKTNAQALGTYRLISALQERSGVGAKTDEELRTEYGVPPHPEVRDVWI